jgi:PKHD-type hydroxylase
MGHPVFALAAHPNRIIGPMFSRYRAGDHYGTHVDEPIIDGSRTDLSFTLFLDEPESYKGGELVFETSAGEDAYKLKPGSVVLYHRRPPCTEWRR